MNEANTLELIELYQAQVEAIEKSIKEQNEHIIELYQFVQANESKRKALMEKLIKAQRQLLAKSGLK